MQPLIAERDTPAPAPALAAAPPAPRQKRDPAPSRIRYRLGRLWLRPWVRAAVRIWIPTLVLVGSGWLLFSRPETREALDTVYARAVDAVRERREFRLVGMSITGASEPLKAQIAEAVGVAFPVSSLDLDLAKVRDRVEALAAVREARVSVVGENVLALSVVEQQPAAILRDGDELALLDTDGHRIAQISDRAVRADLPLLLGTGAEQAVPEALALLRIARPIVSRLRGFVRVGERRWDIVLDRGQRIMLPEKGALSALERVIALQQAEDLLSRDATHIDMRDGERPVLRLTPYAIGEMNRSRTATPQGEET
ncbi:cell division protein FtsQ [Paroceanicella profunda]|uniref:Cell division protein FtsQ n=1 Tax=Paroceanicella profunda TaxID=2579971 RepID=A0A5B8FTU9_9RHOB|nr:cell division protein FtsQ/DivIB [Paroceanicella profunda]QDL90500.1 cell division protein FtsQ [Paroceanicella profunda]